MATNLEIVSPEKLLLSRQVDMVVIPAAEGDMAMIVTLRGGTISLYQDDKVTDQLYVGGGFAEVTPERCTVLANECLPIAEVSRTEADRRLAEAEAAYEGAAKLGTEAEDVALARIQAARAMVEAAGGA